MITIERTTDIEYIKGCVTHPKIWEHSSDDGSGKAEDYCPSIAEGVYWLMPCEDGQRLGVFLLYPHNFICYEVHTCLIPEAWGRSVECTLTGIAWMFSNTPCRRIITNVPESNVLALRLAERSGLVKFGVNPASHLKNGALHDQILLGISKGEK